MIRSKVSDDMINIMLRQEGAVSIKTSPAHINIAKFVIGDDVRLTYMYEVKEEEIYLQRINPYPMMIGKIYNEQQVVDIIKLDIQKFESAYNSSNFNKFIDLASYVSTFNKDIENLFMTHNVPREKLEEIEEEMTKLHQLIEATTEDTPLLK